MTSKRSQSVPQRSLLRRTARYGSVSLLLGGTIMSTGCLDRPVGVSRPVTTNVVVQRQINNAINAIDLLIMIDNSSSMADKQATLADAVPQLLGQLVQPACVDTNGTSHGASLLGATNPCPNGGSLEFNPVNNIHIGIVTSSLGDHGGGRLCTPGQPTSFVDANGTINEPDDVNDKGHLAGTFARYVSTTAAGQNVTSTSEGFLAWGNAEKPAMSAGSLDSATGIFKDMVSATKEMGCGLEAQLEGWFRFLIDPVPPIFPITKDAAQQAHRLGSDDALLAQRAAFLRPDSLVAILMLTDENDCSLRDTDVGWVATDTSNSITRGSDKCATDPNNACCYSCTAGGPPKGCPDGCNPKGPANDDGSFQANIRCFHQKRRFGYEFMYPISRYVVGLTNAFLCPDQTFGDMDCDCKFATKIGASCNPNAASKKPNPLYSNIIGTNNAGAPVQSATASAIARVDNSIVFLAGIVGVPWQDLGYLDANGNLVYIPVTDPSWDGQPAAAGPAPITPVPGSPVNGMGGIWANIYGDDNQNMVPADPHMVEAIEPRAGIQGGDPINGGDWTTAYEDLEYACIYPLTQARDCACNSTATDYSSCKYLHPNDCCDLNFNVDGRGGGAGSFNKPLCNGNSQVKAKGYPGLREIAVLHDYAKSGAAQGNSIVASICPKDVAAASDKTGPGYGYNPAVAALINRLKEKLKGSCLPRPLTPNGDGSVNCNVVEVVGGSSLGSNDCPTYCARNLRNQSTADNPSGQVSAQMQASVLDSMRKANLCDTAGNPCSSFCLCLLPQESGQANKTNSALGSDLAVCQSGDDGQANALDPGYCYVDPDNGAGTNPDLVAKCPDTQRRIIRFAGNNPTSGTGVAVPLPGSMVFTACQGSALGE
jgi:hypothetical protein